MQQESFGSCQEQESFGSCQEGVERNKIINRSSVIRQIETVPMLDAIGGNCKKMTNGTFEFSQHGRSYTTSTKKVFPLATWRKLSSSQILELTSYLCYKQIPFVFIYKQIPFVGYKQIPFYISIQICRQISSSFSLPKRDTSPHIDCLAAIDWECFSNMKRLNVGQ